MTLTDVTLSDVMYSQDDSIENVLENLSRAHRILEMEGHGDMSMGHLSYRDPFGRGLWLKRGNLGLEEVQREDYILIDFEGNVLQGQGLRHLEWPLHTEIMLARPDVNFVGHSHPFYTTVFASTNEKLGAYSNEGVWFAKEGVPRFTLTSNIITTRELGRAHAEALGNAQALLLRNHGASFVGATVKDVTLAGIFLEKAAKFQLTLASSGLSYQEPPDEETQEKIETIYPERARNNFWMYFNRKLDRLEQRGC